MHNYLVSPVQHWYNYMYGYCLIRSSNYCLSWRFGYYPIAFIILSNDEMWADLYVCRFQSPSVSVDSFTSTTEVNHWVRNLPPQMNINPYTHNLVVERKSAWESFSKSKHLNGEVEDNPTRKHFWCFFHELYICWVQSMDPHLAQSIPGLHPICPIMGLH